MWQDKTKIDVLCACGREDENWVKLVNISG